MGHNLRKAGLYYISVDTKFSFNTTDDQQVLVKIFNIVISWRKVLITLIVPIIVAFPWLAILSSPLAEEVIFRHKLEPYDWPLVFFMYLYFLIGMRYRSVKLTFIVFATASIGAFITSTFLWKLSRADCASFCVGKLNQLLGLQCEYAEYGCELESFLISFFTILIVLILYQLVKKRIYSENDTKSV